MESPATQLVLKLKRYVRLVAGLLHSCMLFPSARKSAGKNIVALDVLPVHITACIVKLTQQHVLPMMVNQIGQQNTRFKAGCILTCRSRIPSVADPNLDESSPFSASSCRTKAEDDRERAAPMTIASSTVRMAARPGDA